MCIRQSKQICQTERGPVWIPPKITSFDISSAPNVDDLKLKLAKKNKSLGFTRNFSSSKHTQKYTTHSITKQKQHTNQTKTQMQLNLTSDRSVSLPTKPHTTIHFHNRASEEPLCAANPSLLFTY
eukprot:TRINITY_DN23754_c0_g1_i5.p1 TRINITY_DN23754_c0_g1~~TRINITY_DN23754_c0_g1_i5.p1  ORF type:complete len:125 (+),score=9.14 TRINITY_DN23754_c0_g1_i5:123-497(+)